MVRSGNPSPTAMGFSPTEVTKLHKQSLFRQAAISFAVCLFLTTAPALFAQAQAPDNSAQNKNHATTADQQSQNTSDRETTQKIRQSLMADKSLSTYGHNVKIVTQNGTVILKGPVHSEEEKKAIEQHAADVCGQDKVTSQLTVKQ
jgi:hyperosmotically inducible protein